MYKLKKQEGNARRGELETPHGTVQTPVFMNVGTAAAIKGALSAADLKIIGCQVELSNTYHLHLRPGDELVRDMGGLHKFMTWDGPILTDSGGFQVFSLAGLRKIKEEGVTFALEPHFGQVTKSPETLRRMLDDVGAKNLRIALDMANMVTPENAGDTRALIDGFFDRLSGDIELVHAKDTKIVDGRAVFLGAGKGALDYPYLIERLKGCGYDGAVLLEYVNEAGLQGAYDFVRALV